MTAEAGPTAAERQVAAETGGNTVLSPLSIATAFAMVEAGAGDPTAGQIAAVFGFPDEPGLHEAMNGLTATLAAAERSDPDRGDVVLELTNALWVQRDFAIEEDFLETLARANGAGGPTTCSPTWATPGSARWPAGSARPRST